MGLSPRAEQCQRQGALPLHFSSPLEQCKSVLTAGKLLASISKAETRQKVTLIFFFFLTLTAPTVKFQLHSSHQKANTVPCLSVGGNIASSLCPQRNQTVPSPGLLLVTISSSAVRGNPTLRVLERYGSGPLQILS